MSVIVLVSVAVSISVSMTLSVAEFVSVSMSSVHDRFSVRVHVRAVTSVSNRVRVCSVFLLMSVAVLISMCPCSWLCQYS